MPRDSAHISRLALAQADAMMRRAADMHRDAKTQQLVVAAANTLTKAALLLDTPAARPRKLTGCVLTDTILAYHDQPIPPIFYVCGDYLTGTRDNPLRLLANIRHGKRIADLIAAYGGAAYAPWWDADLAAQYPNTPPEDFLVRSLAFLNAATALVTCSDWSKSRFQSFELDAAKAMGLAVHHIDFADETWSEALASFVELTCDQYWAERGFDLDTTPDDLSSDPLDRLHETARRLRADKARTTEEAAMEVPIRATRRS